MAAPRYPLLRSAFRAAVGGRQPADIARAMTAAGHTTSRQSVSQWLRGEVRPTPERIAALLDVVRAGEPERAAVWQAIRVRGEA